MKIKMLIAAVLLTIIVAASCKEFIEPSLKNRTVILLAPADSSSTTSYSQLFWWDDVDDAISYRLQIVGGSFEKPLTLVADTVIKTSKFTITLSPGTYQWRVRAENGSSQTPYYKRSLTIHQSSIKDQQVQVSSPAGSLVTNQSSLSYKWQTLFGASVYRLQIDTNSFADEKVLVLDSTTPNTELPFSFTREKAYQWRVRAESDSTVSKWSTIRNVTFDNTAPAKVVQTLPLSNKTIAKPVALQWTSIQGAKYQLIVMKSDSSTVFSATFPVSLSSASYNFNDGTSGQKLYWKVRALDDAGNAGPFSDLRNFTIQ